MLAIHDLLYKIGDRTLIDEASLTLPAGVRAGLVGRNGTGKSTLFKLITGELVTETGTISVPRNWRIGQVAQEAPSGADSPIAIVLAADVERTRLLARAETATDPFAIAEIQTRLADIDAHSAEARAATILAGLGFSPTVQQEPVSALSGGWRMRVALAAVLFSEPDLLLLDEPTNYLDLEGAIWLENFLAQYRHTVFIISHDREFLDSAQMIVHLDQGKLTPYRGGYSSFDRQRRERQALQLKMKKKQDEQRRHMQDFVDRFRAKATKARQAQSRLKALARMEPIAGLVEETIRPIVLRDPVRPAAPPAIVLENAAVGYGGPPVLKRLSLRIDPDDRIGLLGPNGNGKSTFAKLLSGRLEPAEGRVKRADRLAVAYFAQHQLDELDPARSAYDHVRALMPDEPEARVRARAGGLGFPLERMDTPSGDLSGGEKARLLIGLAGFAGPHLVILDEPTNHLDVESRDALIQALNDFAGAVILISHDRHLLEATVDRLWVVEDGTVTNFDGDIDDYRRRILDGPGDNESGPRKARQNSAADRRRATAELQPLRKKIRDFETLIEKLQKEIQALDRKLADHALYDRDPAASAELAKQRSDAEKALGLAEEDWLSANADYEAASGPSLA